MINKASQPRSVLSILFIGAFLGPVFLMLWLGRWRWALFYLGLTVLMLTGLYVAQSYALVSVEPVLSYYPAANIAEAFVRNLIGIVHGLSIRRSSLGRPWYRYLAGIPAVICLVLVALLPVRFFLFQPFTIPSASQYPALVQGDYMLAEKWPYGYSRYSFPSGLAHFSGRIWGGAPERGDIAVFKLPVDDRVDYVKRVVGLPGDRVQMKNGILFLNGAAVPRVQVDVPAEYRSSGGATFWRETLPNGRSYVVLELRDNGEADDTDEYAVPAGHYFVLGDNRDNSADSRYLNEVGYVPLENFIGRVGMVVYNSEGKPIGNRPR